MRLHAVRTSKEEAGLDEKLPNILMGECNGLGKVLSTGITRTELIIDIQDGDSVGFALDQI